LLAGRHPAWGYPDQPPLTPLLARLGAGLFGATPTGVRILPALLAAAAITLIGLIGRELGAGRGGQVLAAGAAACSGYVLGIGHLLSTATFDLTAWLTIILLTLRLWRTGEARWWPVLGVATGIVLLNKLLVLGLLAALVVGALTAGPRHLFVPRPRALLGPLAGLLAALPFAHQVLGRGIDLIEGGRGVEARVGISCHSASWVRGTSQSRVHFWLPAPVQGQSWSVVPLAVAPLVTSMQRPEGTPWMLPSGLRVHCWFAAPVQVQRMTGVRAWVLPPLASRHRPSVL
jgi:4-amino-4-deoxy-L-arabinose transferase-like glycosyltransferase